MELMKDLFDGLLGKKEPTISNHYGIKDEEYYKMCKNILCDLIKCKTYDQVLDKHFPKLSAEDRVKVHAYFDGMYKLHHLKKAKI